MLKELHHLLQELRSDDEKIAELAQKNEQDEGLGSEKKAAFITFLTFVQLSNQKSDNFETAAVDVGF